MVSGQGGKRYIGEEECGMRPICMAVGERVRLSSYSPYSRRLYLGEDEGSWSLVFHFCDLTAWSDTSEPTYAPGVPVLKWEPIRCSYPGLSMCLEDPNVILI